MKNKYINIAGKILSILSIIFVLYAIWKRKNELDFSFADNIPLLIAVLVGGIVLKMISLGVSGWGWARWVKFFSPVPFDTGDAVKVYAKANIGKYMPGNVMHFVQRNLFAADRGVSQLQLAMSTVFELITYVLVALLMAVATARESLAKVLTQYFGNKLPILGIIIAVAVVAVIAVLIILRKKIKKVLEGHTIGDFLKTFLTVAVSKFITLMMLGVVFVFLYWYAKKAVTWPEIWTILSAYTIAWVLGFVVPGASGGMGIREMALLLLLGPVMGEAMTLSLSVVHRLITVVGDFLSYLVVIVLEKGRKQQDA